MADATQYVFEVMAGYVLPAAPDEITFQRAKKDTKSQEDREAYRQRQLQTHEVELAIAYERDSTPPIPIEFTADYNNDMLDEVDKVCPVTSSHFSLRYLLLGKAVCQLFFLSADLAG